MIAVVDYGVGNIFSLLSALKFIGAKAVLSGNADEIIKADKIILPGVGAFGDAVGILREKGFERAIIDSAQSGKPLLGICLGMQLLFDKSEEYGEHKGLGLIQGEVKSLAEALGANAAEKVPHIGWNSLVVRQECPLLNRADEASFVYYVHSFYAPVVSGTAAYSEYGSVKISGIVRKGNIFGTQFHPEKSGKAGLDILKAFTELE